MIDLQSRPLVGRDPSVWTKTPEEKRMLKKLRRLHKEEDFHFHNCPKRGFKVWDKLIIQLKKNKEFPKTTYSIECWQSSISEILSRFTTSKKINKEWITESLVDKYYWNGKTYKVNELPYERAC